MTEVAALDEVDLSRLVPTTRRIVAAIGLPATLALLEARGGTYLELPQGTRWRKARHAVAEIIGEGKAEALHAAFAGHPDRRLLLQKPDKLLAQLRDQAIRRAPRSISNRTLALRYRLTVRWVIAIRTGATQCAAADTRQPDLFGGDAA